MYTAILERSPASLATDFISTVPAAISGTSVVNNSFIISGWVRDNIISGPLFPTLTSLI